MITHKPIIMADGSLWDLVELDGEFLMLVRDDGKDRSKGFVRWIGDLP